MNSANSSPPSPASSRPGSKPGRRPPAGGAGFTVKWDKETEQYDYAGQLAKLEDFGALSRFIDDTLSEMAAQLRAGSVAADPWFESFRSNACLNCEFAGACLFDEARDGWRLREDLKTEDAWERIRGNDHG